MGWPVFPCEPNGKRPLTQRGLHDATTDTATTEARWVRWPDANIGLRTGQPSRLVVLDIDGDEGADSLRELERSYAPLPRTATATTPGGGQHIYLKHPGGEIRNSVSLIAPKIDIRADGGYVIAPPSRGPGGREYAPDEQAPVAVMPPWLIALLRQSARPAAAPVDPSEWVSIARHGLRNGERNNGLARYAGHLLARGLDRRLVLEIVLAANARCQPPLGADEVSRIVESIHRLEQRKVLACAREGIDQRKVA
jgi:hypothetical protein